MGKCILPVLNQNKGEHHVHCAFILISPGVVYSTGITDCRREKRDKACHTDFWAAVARTLTSTPPETKILIVSEQL